MVKTRINYIKEKKKEYLFEFKDIVLLYKDHNNYNITQEEFNETLKIINEILNKGRASNVKYVLFCSDIFDDIDKPSINKALFILNSNNYISLNNTRRVSTMFLSYEFAKKNKDYPINGI